VKRLCRSAAHRVGAAVVIAMALPQMVIAQGADWELDAVASLEVRRVKTTNMADARCRIEVGNAVGSDGTRMRMELFLDKRMFGMTIFTDGFTRSSVGIVQLASEKEKLPFNMELEPGALSLFNAQPTLIGFLERAHRVVITSPYVKSGLLIRINIPRAAEAVQMLRACHRQAADAAKAEWCAKFVMPHDRYCGRP
jgi:hypothetical protein